MPRSVRFIVSLAVSTLAITAASAQAVDMRLATDKGTGASVGKITFAQSPHGVVFTPDLKGLAPGVHGFHVHANPNCGPSEVNGKPVPAGAAGGHYDPAGTNRHEGPWGNGHLGDLPALYVDGQGNASYPVLAPRLKVGDLKGRSLMIHIGGDNHADHPQPLGGGGGRLACGVIE